MPQMRVTIIDKVYIDGSCGSKTVASILLARLKRGGHLTHYYQDTIPMRDPLSVQLGPRISLSQCLQYKWAQGNFPIIKNFRRTIYLSIFL